MSPRLAGRVRSRRPAGVVERDRLAVEDEPPVGQVAHQLDHLGHPDGDLVEAAGPDPDVVAVLVHLHADAVELGVHGDLAVETLERRVEVRRARREHGSHRAHDLEAERAQRLLAVAQRGHRHRRGRPREHRRPPNTVRCHLRGRGHRVEHQRVESALTELAGDEPAQVGLLVGRGPAEQVAHLLLADRLGAGSGDLAEPLEGRVDLDRVERRALRRLRQCHQPAPTEPGAPLPERPAEVVHDHGQHLVALGGGARQHVRQGGDFGLAGAGGAHGRVGGDEVGEQHAVILPCRTDALG